MSTIWFGLILLLLIGIMAFIFSSVIAVEKETPLGCDLFHSVRLPFFGRYLNRREAHSPFLQIEM